MNYYNANTDSLEQMYPEIYTELFPLIANTADELMRRGYGFSNETINSAVDNIIKISGMWDEDEEYAIEMQSAPHFSPQHHHKRPIRRLRRRHHNRHTLRDLTRILLLRELFARRNRHH